MAEWINYKENTPKNDMVCIVMNDKGWMYHAKAIYHCKDDVFLLDNPRSLQSFTLQVTHYIEIPHYPKKS